MIDYPKTIEEAKEYRYNVWAGNPNGIPYRKERCVYEVYHGVLFAQCSRKNGHGPRKLYCRQHAGIVEATNA